MNPEAKQIEKKIEALSHLPAIVDSREKIFRQAAEEARQKNPWFTTENTGRAWNAIVNSFLRKEKLSDWWSAYEDLIPPAPKRLGMVLAGNIPMVGFHDLLCAYLSPHHIQVKLSEKDDVLLPFLTDALARVDPDVAERIRFVEKLERPEAVIATGSSNTSRYFEYYFGKYPHIIRRNRTSIALLDGTEGGEELRGLADDILAYFGMGCRNVSKIFVPEDYDLQRVFPNLLEKEDYIHHNKYKNNYDYNLALLSLQKAPFLTNGLLILQESDQLFAPLSVLYVERYGDGQQLRKRLQAVEREIQCVVGHPQGWGLETVPFGATQQPSLSDYADGVDTISFLWKLHA